MSISIIGKDGTGLATTANGVPVFTGNATTTPEGVGALRLFSENDNGSITGTSLLVSPETSEDFRLRVGTDSVWDSEQFNYVAQNFNKHRYLTNTLTVAWSGGSMNTNSAGVTTTGSGCQVGTYRMFPILGSGSLCFETTLAFDNAIPTNLNVDFGAPTLAAASTSIPIDGTYFRINSGGLFGILNINGTEIPSSVFTFTPVINQMYKFLVVVTQTNAQFWVDDVLMGSIPRPVNASQPVYAGSLQWGIRHHHTGVAGGILRVKVGGYSVIMGDLNTDRLWASTMAGQGLSGVQYPSGMAAGITSNNVNSTVPGTAALANATASYATLGGKFLFAAIAGAETDYALFAFLNPIPSTSITGRNLIIRGIWVDTFNAVVAVATTPTVMEWSAAVGSTAVTLATTDTAVARIPKRIALGVQTFVVGALAGAAASRVDVNLDAPLVVEPGTYFHVILRMPYGTATATELFRGQVGVNSYWE